MSVLPIEETNIQEYRSNPYESMDLKDLYTALAKAQGEMENAKLDKKNPYFKSNYADLSSVIKASRPYLSEHGLSVIQRVMTNDRDKMFLFTRLCHISGQWIESKMPINPSKTTIQEIGSYITYLRRYTYASMIGVVGSDDDDDGEQAMDREEKKPAIITKEQVKILSEYTASWSIDRFNKFLDYYGITKIQDLPHDLFNDALEKLQTKKGKSNEDH